MPGLVVYRRRWSIGSDDLVVPGAFLLIIHFICFILVLASLLVCEFNTSFLNVHLLLYQHIAYLFILFFSICAETGICVISMRGSILDADARININLWIYFKSFILFLDITCLGLGSFWLVNYYKDTPAAEAKRIFLGVVLTNWITVFITLITIWCIFDAAGRSWVKMKKYQRSMKDSESRFNYKRSNSTNRNWRQRKVIRAYQDSWDHRCRLLFCCMSSSERNRSSFTDIARLLSDFFRELDVVPSDVVAGLVLLRKFQKLEREAIVRQRKNGTYEFLSGVPITERTQFLALNDAKNYDFFQTVIDYMYYAQGAYGWPMYLIVNRLKVWHILPELGCFGCCCKRTGDTEIIEDNCCLCNFAALKKTLQMTDVEIVYVTCHVDVGETPFFVAIDYAKKKIVISIRGTLSMKDVLTDLNAEGEVLPVSPPRDDWLGHKGMVQAAIYIRNKLQQGQLIEKALNFNPERFTNNFGLVLVGHSLGAGTAAILAILMKPHYPSLECYSYSPPGGLLSKPAVEYSKSFITSVVLGKDLVPRIGLHQMEALRADLINAIQRSVDPKWKTISCSVICCGCGPEPTSVVEMSCQDTHINQYQEQRDTARTTTTHPQDSSIALTLHQPLYPPGRIIHIVRHHPKADENILKTKEPVYQAIWSENTDFDEVLISPSMLQDHMPDKVLAALKKVVTTSGPRKPLRQSSNAFSVTSNDLINHLSDAEINVSCRKIYQQHTNSSCTNLSSSLNVLPTNQLKICRETSFTNLRSPLDAHNLHLANLWSAPGSSKNSSLAGSVLGRSQLISLQYDISSSAIDDSLTYVTSHHSPSLVPSETATVILNSELEHPRQKAVAFDMDTTRSILHRQCSARLPASNNSTLMVVPPLRRASDASKPIDLLHDDWFGLAPLASPETLSEISSISSRTTAISLANSIERYLQNETNVENKTFLDNIYESQIMTPKIMRRAPKFTEGLSKCAEDSRNLDQYKRMGRVFVTFPRILPNGEKSSDTDSSDDSYEFGQAQLNLPENKESSKSADQLDQPFIGVHKTAPGIPQKEENKNQLTFSDSQILTDDCLGACPNNPRRLALNNNDIMSRQGKADQESAVSNFVVSANSCISNTTGSSVDTTYFSANSSLEQFVTPVHLIKNSSIKSDNSSPLRPGVLESHFPVLTEATTKTQKSSPSIKNVIGGRLRKRLSSEEFIFTRTEDLPLIVQISEKCGAATPSPSFSGSESRKRKSCVYPAGNYLYLPHAQKVKRTVTTKYLSENSSPSKDTKLTSSNSESSV